MWWKCTRNCRKNILGSQEKKKDNIKKQHMFITNKPKLEIIK